MNSEFTLVPYVGAMPVTFEMTPADVEHTLGFADVIGVNDLGERDESRGPVSIRYSKDDGKVVEIVFDPTATLLFQGTSLFGQDALVDFLLRFDPQPFEFVGFLIFLGLGITITGFHDQDDAQKGIMVFRRGRLDGFREEFSAYSKGDR